MMAFPAFACGLLSSPSFVGEGKFDAGISIVFVSEDYCWPQLIITVCKDSFNAVVAYNGFGVHCALAPPKCLQPSMPMYCLHVGNITRNASTSADFAQSIAELSRA